jgi:hypothetical protein
MYFIISYNSCGAFKYSNVIKIDYKNIDDNPFLLLNNNIINFENYEEDKAKILCYS